MTRDERKLFNALKAMGCPVISRPDGDADGAFVISAEDNVDRVWADYWEDWFGEFGVAQDVCDVVRKHGFFCEWINPGIVGVYK